MALLGAQLVFSMITASLLSKLSGKFSFGRWVICNRLVRFLHPSDEELRKLAGVQRKYKSHGPKTDPKKAKEEAFSIPKSVDIQLDTAPITAIDILPLRFYTDYQWLMDFTVCSLFVYLVTELYYALVQPNEFNLSIVWGLLVMGFAVKVLFSVTAIYFDTDDAGERILCFVFAFFFLVLAMGILIVSEDTLDFGLETGYYNFSSGARQFLDKQGLETAGPASLLTFRVILAVVCSILGAFLTFPGLRLAKMHTDALKYTKENPFTQMLLHLNIISPLFIVVLWVRPICREYLVDRDFSSGKPLMTSDHFDCLRVLFILGFCLLRMLLSWTHLQAHLNIAYDNVARLKKEAGKISSLELQKLVVRVYYYLCVVALQYFAPLILLLLFCLMLKTLGCISFSTSFGFSFPVLGTSKSPVVSEGLPLSEDPATLAETAAQFSFALSNLRQVFTPLWYKVLNKIPFAKIHQDPIPFDDSQRKCFLPGQRISIKVVNAEPAENGRLLNPNMYLPGLPILFQEYRYVVQVNHGDYEWIVRRRYKHFRQIHEHLVLMRAGAKLPVPTARHRERRKSLARNKHTLPKFPKRPDPLVRVEHLEKRKKELGDYLESILRHPLYRKDQEVLRFLEVSHLSFVNGLGQKGKEGIVQKRAGGRKIALHWCLCMRGCTPTLHWNKTWLLVKDTFVAYVRPQDGTIRDVLLMDQDFVVECGLMKTGIRHGLMISNLTRELLLKCWTQRKAREWQEQILNTMQRAADFTEPNRFGSFAPVRKDAYTTWFVDGATYMAAVADGIEAAKEEIFITDWWLSPEIYLKRPKVDDDERWRLDIMLKKKACEGVKIYIQIYKELEVALGINSYYSKQALMKLHPTNIKVMRHPDGINLWSHHEKSVIIDQRLAFMGGIDLCYGRWDTRLHRLTDLGSESLSQFYGEGETKTAQMSPTAPRAFPKDTKRVAFDSGLDTIAESQQSLDAPAIVIERVDSGRTEDTLLSEAGDGEDDVVGRDTEAGIDEVDTETVEAQGETNGSYINHSAETDNGDLVIDNHEPGTSGEEDLQHSDDEDGDAVPTQSGEVSEELVEIAITDGDPTQDNSGDEGETPSSSSKKLTISRQTRVAEDSPASPHRDISGESPDSEPCSPEVSTSENAPSDHSETNEPIENDGAKESHSTDQNDNEMCGREEARVAPGDAEMSRDDSIESISGIATFKSFLSSLSNQTYDILHEAVEQHAADTAVEEEGSEDITPEAKPKVKSRFRSPRLHLNMPHMTKSRREGSPDASPANSPKGGRRDLGGGESQGSLTTPDSDGFLGAPGKPTTPTMAKKKFGQALRERFRKQKSMSIDITEERPHDDDVYNRKEMESTSDPHQILGDESGNFKLWVGKDYVNFIFKDLVELDKPFTDFVDRTVTARMPWHDIGAACFGRPARDVARHFIQRWNFCKLQKQKDNMEFPMLLPKAYSNITVPSWVSQSTFTANCQILRSSSEWSAGIKITEASIQDAYIQLIEDSKHYIFIENQFFISITDDKVVKNKLADALYERIIKAHREEKTFRVYVILPLLPAFEGEVGTPHGTAIQAVTHWNYSSICRGGKSLLERLVPIVSDPFKYISFYGLRTHEELQGRMATELVYVHSKLMIVDDFSVIIGSANLNDRSLKGDRDSELAIIVQDTQTVSSTMNGQPYMAGAFASSLRKNLFREHLGVTDKDMYADVTDPICDAFYKKIWIRQASINTGVYEEVFHCMPSDRGTTFKNLKEYQAEPGLIDTDPDSAKRELRKVKGHLVLLPLQFLKEENLAPARGTKESLAPTVIWT